MILDLLMCLADIIAMIIAFAILIFGMYGILYGIASLLHDFLSEEEDEE